MTGAVEWNLPKSAPCPPTGKRRRVGDTPGSGAEMALLDIVGLTKRLDEGQRDLNDRLDRVIALLEALLDVAPGRGEMERPHGRFDAARTS